jgi:hypothetical protein
MNVARLARQLFASSVLVLVLAVASSIGGITGCAEDGACLCPTIYTEFTAWTATVTDSTGAIVLDARAYERLEGGEEGEARCLRGTAGASCERFSSRYGKPGTYFLRATRADGSSSTELTVVVPARTTCCGTDPVPQTVTIALSP